MFKKSMVNIDIRLLTQASELPQIHTEIVALLLASALKASIHIRSVSVTAPSVWIYLSFADFII